MRGGRKWMERTYRAKNGTVERTRFLVGVTARPRSRKEGKSSERKQEQNKNSAARILGRLLNNNFSQADLFLTLNYRDEDRKVMEAKARRNLPKRHTREQVRNQTMKLAKRDAMLFLRRVKRTYKAAGEELRAIVVLSDMDGKTDKPANIHAHIILSGQCAKLEDKTLTICGRNPAEIWGHGQADWEFLRAGSYNALAAYLIKQVRKIENWKAWTPTQNLEKIIPEERELAPSLNPHEEIPAPVHARIEERTYFGEASACQYLRYVQDPPAEKRGGHKSRREKT